MAWWSPCSATARSCDCTHDEIPDKGAASTSVPIRLARSGPSARRCSPCIDRFSPHDGFDPRAGGSEVHRRRKRHALVVEEEMRPRGVTLCPHLPPELVQVARVKVDVGMIWGLIAQTDLKVQDRNLRSRNGREARRGTADRPESRTWSPRRTAAGRARTCR